MGERTPEFLRSKRRRNPPKNFRRHVPRCCGTCEESHFDNGALFCERKGATVCDAEDHYLYICDYWKGPVIG